MHRFRGHSVYGKLFQKSACAVGWGAVIYFLARSGNASADAPLGCRLMAGQRILVPSMGVRLHTARSSSGSGRRPLKAEITSSNLVRATKCSTRVARPGFFHTCWQIAAAGGSECRPRRAMRPAARHPAGLAGATAPFGCADGRDGPVPYPSGWTRTGVLLRHAFRSITSCFVL